jgi:hypothetical protein
MYVCIHVYMYVMYVCDVMYVCIHSLSLYPIAMGLYGMYGVMCDVCMYLLMA